MRLRAGYGSPLFGGIVTEVYYPTVDRPQLRDLQYLVTDGKSFFHEEKRDLKTTVERISGHTLGFHCTNSDPQGRYSISKDVITDPHLPCVLQRTRLTGPDEKFLTTLKFFALCAPHLQVGGYGNTGYVTTANGWRILMASKQGVWLAMTATVPFPEPPVATWERAMAGPTCMTISKWIMNSIVPRTAISLSPANWISVSPGSLRLQLRSEQRNIVRLRICFSLWGLLSRASRPL